MATQLVGLVLLKDGSAASSSFRISSGARGCTLRLTPRSARTPWQAFRRQNPTDFAPLKSAAHCELPHRSIVPSNPRTVVDQTGDDHAVGVRARIPLGKHNEEFGVGFAASDIEGLLLIAFRDGLRETALAVRTDALATAPVGRSPLRLAALGAAIGARDSFEAAVAGGLTGLGLHLLVEAIVRQTGGFTRVGSLRRHRFAFCPKLLMTLEAL